MENGDKIGTEAGSNIIQIIIDDNYELPQLKTSTGEPKLDKFQTALLFNYLREHNIILNQLSNSALAKMLAILTGHSEQKMRTDHGLGAIDHIKKGILNSQQQKAPNPLNLEAVRNSLLEILSELDKEISKIK